MWIAQVGRESALDGSLSCKAPPRRGNSEARAGPTRVKPAPSPSRPASTLGFWGTEIGCFVGWERSVWEVEDEVGFGLGLRREQGFENNKAFIAMALMFFSSGIWLRESHLTGLDWTGLNVSARTQKIFYERFGGFYGIRCIYIFVDKVVQFIVCRYLL